MPILVMAVVALILFLVMGVLFVSAAMLEGKRRREAAADVELPAIADLPEVKAAHKAAGK